MFFNVVPFVSFYVRQKNNVSQGNGEGGGQFLSSRKCECTWVSVSNRLRRACVLVLKKDAHGAKLQRKVCCLYSCAWEV